MSVHLKMAKVAAECGYVQKDGTNDFHKYKFASAGAVMSKINAALSKHGLSVSATPTLVSRERVQSERGGSSEQCIVSIELCITDPETKETLKTSGLGAGQDKGDKAIMKAQTAAIKYAWMLCCSISTGDDPESDAETDERAEPDGATVKDLIALIQSIADLSILEKWVDENKAALASLPTNERTRVRNAYKAHLDKLKKEILSNG